MEPKKPAASNIPDDTDATTRGLRQGGGNEKEQGNANMKCVTSLARTSDGYR